jgi:antitoxin component YwqK of YwqJK toxin-antitoxin module
MKIILLIKILLIGIVLSSFSMGQNQLKSLDELKKDLNYYTNVVRADNLWFIITAQLGTNGKITYSTELLPRKDAIRKFINNLKAYGTFNQNTIKQDVEQMYLKSEGIKSYIRNTVIPQLKYNIANHPDNKSTLGNSTFSSSSQGASGATECHSQGSGSVFIGNQEMGVRCTYYSNGQLHEEAHWAHNQLHGYDRQYYSNGNPKLDAYYWNGRLDGILKGWRQSGEMYKCYKYNHGKRVGTCMSN